MKSAYSSPYQRRKGPQHRQYGDSSHSSPMEAKNGNGSVAKSNNNFLGTTDRIYEQSQGRNGVNGQDRPPRFTSSTAAPKTSGTKTNGGNYPNENIQRSGHRPGFTPSTYKKTRFFTRSEIYHDYMKDLEEDYMKELEEENKKAGVGKPQFVLPKIKARFTKNYDPSEGQRKITTIKNSFPFLKFSPFSALRARKNRSVLGVQKSQQQGVTTNLGVRKKEDVKITKNKTTKPKEARVRMSHTRTQAEIAAHLYREQETFYSLWLQMREMDLSVLMPPPDYWNVSIGLPDSGTANHTTMDPQNQLNNAHTPNEEVSSHHMDLTQRSATMYQTFYFREYQYTVSARLIPW